MCIDLYHSSLLSFIEILIKVTPLQQIAPITSINLITWGEFGEISPTDLKSVAKLPIHHIYINDDFTMSKGEWVEIIEISIISQSSLMTLTRLRLVGLFLIYFIKFSIKFTSE